MHTQPNHLPIRPSSRARDKIYNSFTQVFDAPQTNTDLVIAEALRKIYPDLHLTISSSSNPTYLGFAASGQATAVPLDSDDAVTSNLKWKFYAPPSKRIDGGEGALGESVQFGKYLYTWNDKEYLLYIITGMQGNFHIRNSYLLGPSKADTESLMLAAGHYGSEVHDEILVFDGGYWEKSRELWRSVEHSTWDDVILDESMKKAIMGEINNFFNSRERYAKLKVPWKRGIIYYGPPGNGKTISIKATMHALSRLASPIPTLYVRSLSSYGGPEYAISSIFRKARQYAPCYLIFEDLDSIVTDNVRSYFLNEVDGLESNNGILMIGSTNHLERLDPGISKRPSRFDRKYFFPNPDEAQRVQYCKFWRKKLDGSEDVEFPQVLEKAIAGITDGFSFAYMQEAFVASLLAIASQEGEKRQEEEEENGEEEWNEGPQEDVEDGASMGLMTDSFKEKLTTTIRESIAEAFEKVNLEPPTPPKPPHSSTRSIYRLKDGQLEKVDNSDPNAAQARSIIKYVFKPDVLAAVASAKYRYEGLVLRGEAQEGKEGRADYLRKFLADYNYELPPPRVKGMSESDARMARYRYLLTLSGIEWTDEDWYDAKSVESIWGKEQLDRYVLWRQMKKQVEILRREVGEGK